jgi:hypothetical protein
LYAARGRLIPFNSNSPTGSTFTAFSTFINTTRLGLVAEPRGDVYEGLKRRVLFRRPAKRWGVTNSHVDSAVGRRLVTSATARKLGYGSGMGDTATFLAPAFLVTYLAVGGLLLLSAKGQARRRRGVSDRNNTETQ